MNGEDFRLVKYLTDSSVFVDYYSCTGNVGIGDLCMSFEEKTMGIKRNTPCRLLVAMLFVFGLGGQAINDAFASPGGHGGGGGGGGGGPAQPNPYNPTGGGGGGGGEGFGASSKAINAWEAAGGRKGTGMSFQEWFRKQRIDWEARQDELTSDQTWAGWGASAWNLPVWGGIVADTAGKISQFGLNFVPGVGKLTSIGLDAARGAADGYGKAVDKGLSQSEAASAAGKTGIASGLFSAFTQKFGFAKDAGKAIKASQAARTAAKITSSNKKLGTALVGTTVQEGVKEVVGNVHNANVVNNTSPQAQLTKD